MSRAHAMPATAARPLTLPSGRDTPQKSVLVLPDTNNDDDDDDDDMSVVPAF